MRLPAPGRLPPCLAQLSPISSSCLPWGTPGGHGHGHGLGHGLGRAFGYWLGSAMTMAIALAMTMAWACPWPVQGRKNIQLAEASNVFRMRFSIVENLGGHHESL